MRASKEVVETLTTDTIADISIANASLKYNIRKVIAEDLIAFQSASDTKKRIIEQLYDPTNGMSITINNRNYDIRSYSETLVLTATKEAMNTGADQLCDDKDIDLFYMSIHFPTCEVCAPLQGRAYSRTGMTKG